MVVLPLSRAETLNCIHPRHATPGFRVPLQRAMLDMAL